MVDNETNRKHLTERILNSLTEACKESSNAKFQESLWMATALTITLKQLNRMLLHRIAWAPVSNIFKSINWSFVCPVSLNVCFFLYWIIL